MRAASFLNMNLGYICGTYGLTKTTDGGETFTEVGAGNFPFTELRDIHFFNENTGYVLGSYEDAFAKTTDGGNTWVKSTTLPQDFYYDMIVFSEQRIIVSGSYSGTSNIYLTTDGGATWTASAAGNLSIFSMTFLDSLTGFAGSEGGMAYKTTDGGLSWNVVTTLNALPTDAFFSMFNEGSNLYVLSYDSTLYVSTDAGATFTSSQFLPSGNIPIVMRAGTVVGSTLFLAGDLGSFYKSTNNGTSWQSPTKIAKLGYIQDVYANNADKIIAVGEPTFPSTIGEQIIISDDGGQNWTSISLTSLDADLRSIKMIDDNTGYTVGSSGGIWKTTNGGYNWNQYSSPTTEQAFNAVDFYNVQYGMTAGNNGEVWKTTDGGTTWTSLTGLIPSDYFNGIAMIDSISALAIGFSVYKTTDGGLTWATLSPTFPDSPPSKIKMFNQSVGVIVGPTGFFGFNPFVYKTTDGGDTWNSMNFPFSTTDKLYNVEFRTADDIVVVGNNGGVFHTSDNGANWTQFNLGLMNFFSGQMLGVAFSGPNEVIVGGASAQIIKVELDNVVPVELVSFTCEVNNPNIKLHWTTASELNNQGFEVERKTSESNLWETIGNVPGRGTTTNSTDYYFNDDNLAPAVYNYRIKQVDYDGSIEYSQVINADLTTPNTFTLEQNYPNPFNPSTSISYSIPNNSFVTLKVYDILGNEVATLVNQTQAAGNYTLTFDASNLSNGVYLYSIKADNFSDVKKMIFMK